MDRPHPLLEVNPAKASEARAIAPEIVALVNGAYRGEGSKRGWTTEAGLIGGQRTNVALVEEIIRDPQSVILLARHSGDPKIIGVVHLQRKSGGVAYLGMLTIDVTIQARGLGSVLVRAAEKYVWKEWRTKRMEMTVISLRMELISWYSRRGYRRTNETRPFPYGNADFGEPLTDGLEFEVLEKNLSEELSESPFERKEYAFHRWPEVMRFALSYFSIILLVGIGAMIFMKGLDAAASVHTTNSLWILSAPFVGLLTSYLYRTLSPASAGGMTLVEQVVAREAPVRAIPRMMAPLVTVACWLSHLAGLSVGREGVAVQIGAGIAAHSARFFALHKQSRQRMLLLTGIGAGFAAVFGVPWAGMVFAFEFRVGSGTPIGPREHKSASRWLLRGRTLVLVLVASFAADALARACGLTHMEWSKLNYSDLTSSPTWILAVGLIGALIIFSLLAITFTKSLRGFRKFWSKVVREPFYRSAIGGLLFSGLIFWPDLFRYCGLGTKVIKASLGGDATWIDPIAKLALTVFSIGTGFRGGEVTPLLFIGSTAGSAWAQALSISPAWLGAIGLAAVFGAVFEVPFAAAVLAAEMFGVGILPLAVPICWLSSKICRRFTKLSTTRV